MALPLVAATANPHKLEEIEAILGDLVELLPRPDSVGDVVEDAPTLLGNARLKAAAICAATGMAAVADDTGLFVDALDGAPGVHSARYAGPEADAARNLTKLLTELDGTAVRTARFRTVALIRWPDARELAAHGVVEGTIIERGRGAGGFGYDPVFVPADGDGSTFAEMADEAKNLISHRGRAFRNLLAQLD